MLGRAFTALGFESYRRFALAHLLNSLGAQAIQVAILWHVYVLTGSPLLLGLTGLARALPHIALSLIGGVIADRVDRIRLIQAGQLANGVLTLGLAAFTLAEPLGVTIGARPLAVQPWHLYLAAFLNSAFSAISQPARSALIPRLVPQETLVNAVALNATVIQTAQIVGPAVGGTAISVIDLGPTYLINALAYLAAIWALARVRAPGGAPAPDESPWRSLAEGVQFVRQKPVILSLLALDLAETVFGSYRALLPLFAAALGVGAAGYGLLSAAPGVGSLVGAGFVLSLGDMRYKGLYTVFGVLGYAAALLVLALSPWFGLSLAAAGLLGATNSVQMIPRNSVILAIAPDVLRGRVEAFRSMLAGGGPPLGYAASGLVAAAVGAPLALAIGAGACALTVALVALTRRELRDPDLGAEPPVAAAPAVAEASGVAFTLAVGRESTRSV